MINNYMIIIQNLICLRDVYFLKDCRWTENSKNHIMRAGQKLWAGRLNNKLKLTIKKVLTSWWWKVRGLGEGKVTWIQLLGTKNVYTKSCVNPAARHIAGVNSGVLRQSPKSAVFILWGPWQVHGNPSNSCSIFQTMVDNGYKFQHSMKNGQHLLCVKYSSNVSFASAAEKPLSFITEWVFSPTFRKLFLFVSNMKMLIYFVVFQKWHWQLDTITKRGMEKKKSQNSLVLLRDRSAKPQ